MFVKLLDEIMHEVYAYDDDRGMGITFCGQFVGPYDVELGPPSNCPLCLSLAVQMETLSCEEMFGKVKAAAEERGKP